MWLDTGRVWLVQELGIIMQKKESYHSKNIETF